MAAEVSRRRVRQLLQALVRGDARSASSAADDRHDAGGKPAEVFSRAGSPGPGSPRPVLRSRSPGKPDFNAAMAEIRRARTKLEALAYQRARETHADLKTLAVVILVWFVAGYTMALAGVIALMRVPRGNGDLASQRDLILPDLGFDALRHVWLPEVSSDPASPAGMYNVIMTLVVTLTVVRVILHPDRVLIWRRILIVHTVICFVRSFFIVMTSLPDPYHPCHNFVLERNLFVEAFFRAVTFGFSACGDVFFSGHMATCVLCASVWRTYTKQKYANLAIGVLVLLEAVYMLKLRFHYSIDIAIGSYIAHRVYDSFHSNWSPFFGWLEASPVVLDSSDEDIVTWLSRCPPVTEIQRQLDLMNDVEEVRGGDGVREQAYEVTDTKPLSQGNVRLRVPVDAGGSA